MSVYNTNRHLAKSIESILAQTCSDFEFLIVNDASTDDSEDIIEQFASRDERIRILENKSNLGLPTSLNKGLKIARGQYIARQDADDISLPSRLEIQKTHLDRLPIVNAVQKKLGLTDHPPRSAQLGQKIEQANRLLQRIRRAGLLAVTKRRIGYTNIRQHCNWFNICW